MKIISYCVAALFLTGCQAGGLKPQAGGVSEEHAETYVQCLEVEMTSKQEIKKLATELTSNFVPSNLVELDMKVFEQGLLEVVRESFTKNRKSLKSAVHEVNKSDAAIKHKFVLSGINGCDTEWRAAYLRLSTDQSVKMPAQFRERAKTITTQEEYVVFMVDLIEYSMSQSDVDNADIEMATAAFKDILPVYISELGGALRAFGQTTLRTFQFSDNRKIRAMRMQLAETAQ